MSDDSISISLSQLKKLVKPKEGPKKRRGRRSKNDAEATNNQDPEARGIASMQAHDDLTIKLLYQILVAGSDYTHAPKLKW